MTEQSLTALGERFARSVDALRSGERAQLLMWFPRLRETPQAGDETVSEDRIAVRKLINIWPTRGTGG
ncbi:hypothetical protein ABZ805_08660 [Saccharopolyspora sp. NPDC047091]|uniref:hypothetical protein n=1 Tax=Saccharopolyspora sp. NPDC047091 TaxID=3155924 RepID=UPI0033E6D6C3